MARRIDTRRISLEAAKTFGPALPNRALFPLDSELLEQTNPPNYIVRLLSKHPHYHGCLSSNIPSTFSGMKMHGLLRRKPRSITKIRNRSDISALDRNLYSQTSGKDLISNLGARFWRRFRPVEDSHGSGRLTGFKAALVYFQSFDPGFQG
jgi:hypothetical protein